MTTVGDHSRPRLSLEHERELLGLALAAAMLAFPAPWKYKLAGIGLGTAAVQAVNVVRVISLFYLGQWDMKVFEFAHLYLWQALIMLDVLVVWLLWVRFLAGRSLLPSFKT